LRVQAEKGIVSGDWQYLVDLKAEELITRVFENLWGKGYSFGYLTEEQGLILPKNGDVDKVSIIDPVDGSRPAQRGLNSCNIVIGVVDYDGSIPRLSDVKIGIVKPLLENSIYVGVIDQGKVYVVERGKFKEVNLAPSKIDSLEQCFVDVEDYDLPSEIMGVVYSSIVEAVNARFIYHCLSYGLLSLARGTVEAVVDARLRILDEFPELVPRLGMKFKVSTTLDIAGVYPINKLSKIIITGAYKLSLDNTPIWIEREKGFSSLVEISCLAASSQKLYDEIYDLLLEGINHLRV